MSTRLGLKTHLVQVLVLVCVVLVGAQQANAGRLYFVTRAKTEDYKLIHIAAVIEYDDGSVEWVHFRATKVTARTLLFRKCPGHVTSKSFEEGINHIAGFAIPDRVLRRAKESAISRIGRVYQLRKNDCVEFVWILAGECGLKTERGGNLLPVNFFNAITKDNTASYEQKNVDRMNGYRTPWRK